MNEINDLIPFTNLRNMTSEDFRKKALENIEQHGVVDKLADAYAKFPSVLKIVKNIDPTGIFSTIDEVLSESKAKREQNMIIDALYHMLNHMSNFEDRIKEVLRNNAEEFSMLTEVYYEKSKECHEKEKIKYFSDIWCNAILNNNRSISEKEYIFDLISSLSYDQINILKFIYDEIDCEVIDGAKNIDENTRPIGVQAYATTRGIEYAYTIQLCTSLVGKGLLNMGASSMLQSTPTHFTPAQYVNIIIEFLSLS